MEGPVGGGGESVSVSSSSGEDEDSDDADEDSVHEGNHLEGDTKTKGPVGKQYEEEEEDDDDDDEIGGSEAPTPSDSASGDIVHFLESNHAEARLAAKRQARAEAREIRMRELEKHQKEFDDPEKVYDSSFNSTNVCDGLNRSCRVNSCTPRLSNSYQSSRRSSEDSLEETSSLRDVRLELRELEEKFRKAMIGNAQLDNEKTAATYQVELYKDKYEELEESFSQLQREHRDKCRELELLKRESRKISAELKATKEALEERDTLIQEKGLVIVGGEGSSSEDEALCDGSETSNGETNNSAPRRHKKALVSTEMADYLNSAGSHGSLDVRLKRLAVEKNELSDELRHVKLELEEEKAKIRSGSTIDDDYLNREVNKQLGDYKFKLQKAEQDISTLQTTVTRLEGQVLRYKTSSEALEKVEAVLKAERRKLLRELRESQARVEELETAHSHLQKRLDKLKNAKSALLKDL